MSDIKVCVITSGIHWQLYGWRHIGYEPFLAYVKDKLVPNKHDIIIVPKGIHPDYFKNYGQSLIDFMHRGGILITFGEIPSGWIPECTWTKTVHRTTVNIQQPVASISLKCGINCMFPGEFASWVAAPHGYFSKIPIGSEIIATEDGDTNRVLLFYRRFEGGGYLLATTLDPDYHSYTENKCAQCFLELLIEWAREKVHESKAEQGRLKSAILTWESVLKSALHNRKKLLIQFVIGAVIAFFAHTFFK